MWTIHIIQQAFEALDPASHIRRPLMSYLDELAYHLDHSGFEPSTDLERATADLEAILGDGAEVYDVASPYRTRRTAVGCLLDAALEAFDHDRKHDLRRHLRKVIEHLDADLRGVLWLTPLAMDNTQERLARAAGARLPSGMA